MTQETALLEALPVAAYTTDAAGTITYFNDAAAEIWGRRPSIGKEKWSGAWKLYRTDGQLLAHAESEVALSLREGRAIRGVEGILERPDGTQILFAPYPALLRDQTGNITGVINALLDLSDRKRSEIEAARFAAIVYSSDDAIISKTLDGIVTSWNASAERIFGFTEEEMIGQPIIKIIPPDLRHEEEEIIGRIRRGERTEHYETVRLTKNGGTIDISLTVSPVLDKYGRVIGASKVARDITERKKAERLQKLLTNELDHRVRNTLATVQAIATQSLHHARTPAEFNQSFSGRIQAMAAAHSLLTQNHKTQLHGANIVDVVRNQVLLGGGDPRVSYNGPNILLETQETVHLSLVLHELATNARKYGALSTPQGQLSINWHVRDHARRHLVLEWQEHAGPKVSQPTRTGFGSTLIRTTMHAHGGNATIVYATSGLLCSLEMPLATELGSMQPAYASSSTEKIRRATQTSPRLVPRRVLVVEDEPLVAMDIATTLQSSEHIIVGPASSIEAAQGLAKARDYDVALLDVNLGGASIESVAEIVAGHGIPFAFLTGYGQGALPAKFKGAVILGKPFNPDHLLDLVNRLGQQNTATEVEVAPPAA
jgi:PAS domain S-box-containing protein